MGHDRNVRMQLVTEEPHVVAEATRKSPTPAPGQGARRNWRLIITLALVIAAGFLLGLGVPIHL